MTALTLCSGEPCLLRGDGVGSGFIAKLVLRVMARDPAVDELVASGPDFVPRDHCVECVHRVMSDRGPLRTEQEHRRSVNAGRWSRRRWRRQRRRDKGNSAAPATRFL